MHRVLALQLNWLSGLGKPLSLAGPHPQHEGLPIRNLYLEFSSSVQAGQHSEWNLLQTDNKI